MTPEQLDRVFGRGRLKMVTGDHVEVFREAATAGDRRRYTKRFLNTVEADFGQWTEREWRILARLIGHGIDCVPEVVQFDRGGQKGTQLVQTYDAGATVDQWATILPVVRGGRLLRHVFEDCAHWWALAHHCLRALSAIHELSVVHLDIKGDNVCIPVWPATFDPQARGTRLQPRFEALALIDFAFSLISRERLSTALPIGWQTEYDYQSPRLLQALEAGRRGDLQPTRELDWRCDVYSLGAMLRRYMPSEDRLHDATIGWTPDRAAAAKDLILALRDAHDRDGALARPYPALMGMTSERLAEPDMAASLAAGWLLARDMNVTPVAASPRTPLTRLAPSLRVMVSPRAAPQRALREAVPPAALRRRGVVPEAPPRSKRHRAIVGAALVVLVSAGVAAMVAPTILSRIDWPGEASPAPVAREDDVPRAESPAPGEPEATPPSVADAAPAPAAAPPAAPAAAPAAAPTAAPAAPPAGPAAPTASRPPSRTAPSHAPAVAAAKAAPRPVQKVAIQQPTGRVRFHQEPPIPATLAPPVQEAPAAPVLAAAPAPVEAPAKPPPAPAQAAPPPPKPTVRAPDVRGLLTMLFDLGRHDKSRAPIEERVVASAPTRAQPEPPPVEVAPVQKMEPAPVAFPPPPPAPAIVREPAPRASSPIPDPDLAVQARRMLAESIPYSAARAQGELSRVMWIAAGASRPGQERVVADAVRQSWTNYQVVTSASSISPATARQLGEDARHAYLVDRDVARAFDLQLRAFGANPRDPELAGNLAFLLLRVQPVQAESARQLAVHAIALAASQRTGRSDDWTTLAVANALTGREADATNALYVAVALSRNLDASCRAALSAIDSHGERVAVPVGAMMARIREQGRERESPSCAMPARYANARASY